MTLIYNGIALIIATLVGLFVLPGDLALGNIRGKLVLEDTRKPFVFWFSHCFDPAVYIHCVILSAQTVQKYRPGTTLYVCSAVLPTGFSNFYINFQLRTWKGLDKVRVLLVRRPFRVAEKTARGDSVVVLHPSDNLRIHPDYRTPEVIKSMLGKINRSSPFHPHLNPFRRIPDTAQIIICSLLPVRSYEGPCLLPLGFNPDTGFSPDFLRFISRVLFTDYEFSYSLPTRHNKLIDYELLAMLVNAIGGTQRLGMCTISNATTMFE